MITLPIWLFVICIIIGLPLLIMVFTFIGYIVYLYFLLIIGTIKSLWFKEGENLNERKNN